MDESKKKMRLQKFLSQAGVASRREGERLILEGRVSVNGKKATQLGTTIDAEQDQVLLNGKIVRRVTQKVYYLFHKPKNVMVTRHDPEGRPTVFEYLKKIPERVNYVGRLDFDSEGLLLLTNDGELHYRMTHPSKEIAKVYRVRVVGEIHGLPLSQIIKKLSSGVDIGGYVTAPCRVRRLEEDWLEITITEGKNRQIRRMLEAVGCRVVRLIRISIGPFQLGNLRPGQFRQIAMPPGMRLVRSGVVANSDNTVMK